MCDIRSLTAHRHRRPGGLSPHRQGDPATPDAQRAWQPGGAAATSSASPLARPDGPAPDADPRFAACAAMRVLSAVVTEGERALVLQAELGELATIALRNGAARVVALEENARTAALMAQFFMATGFDETNRAEALHGIAQHRTTSHAASAECAAPEYNLPMILREEGAKLLIVRVGRGSACPLDALPPSVNKVVLVVEEATGHAPALDRALAELLQAGFRVHPTISEGAAFFLYRDI